MKLYMVRHGQSVANFNKQHVGWGQVPLTEKGEDDARGAGEILKNYSFDKVYSSDLLRAMQTQKIALPNETAELCELIREVGVGSLSGKKFEDCEKELGEEYINLRTLGDFRSFGGEDKNTHRERVGKFFDMVAKQNYESVAAFTHAGTILRAFDLTVCEGEEIPFPKNCGIFLFEFKDGKWSFIKEITE